MDAELVAALKALRFAMTTSGDDWGASKGGTYLYGIVVGWNGDPDDSADEGSWALLADRWGWADDTVTKLKGHHAAIEAAIAAENRPWATDRCRICLGDHLVTQKLDGREVSVSCPACQPTLLEG